MRMPVLSALIALALVTPVAAIDSSFTYQGTLEDDGAPATGAYDFDFRLQNTAGNEVSSPLTFDDVAVVAGVFTVALDFDGVPFGGDDRFLVIAVRPGDSSGAYTTLAPRTKITSTPYAQLADGANFAASVADDAIGSAQIANESILSADIANGTVGSADIDAAQVQSRVQGACAAGFSINAIASNGSVTCEADDTGGSGDITGVSTPAGSGLGGGVASGDASLSIANDGVNSARIANGSIGGVDIDADQVQRRIASSCPTGQTMTGVSSLGVPTCAAPAIQSFLLEIPSAFVQALPAQNCQNNTTGVTQTIDGAAVVLPAGTYMVTMPLIGTINPIAGPVNGVLLSSSGFIDTNLKRVGGGLGNFATGRLQLTEYLLQLSTDSHTRIFSLAQPTSMFVQVEARIFYCGQVQSTAGRELAVLKIQ